MKAALSVTVLGLLLHCATPGSSGPAISQQGRGVPAGGLCRTTTYCRACDPSVRYGTDKYTVGVTTSASTNLPKGTWVWIDGLGKRRVTDRGSKVYVRKGMTADFDVLVASCAHGPGTKTRRWRLISLPKPQPKRHRQ